MDRKEIYAALDSERDYQDKKWGDVHTERVKEVGSYLTIIRGCLNRAEARFMDSKGDQEALTELRKVAAVCVACFENHGVAAR